MSDCTRCNTTLPPGYSPGVAGDGGALCRVCTLHPDLPRKMEKRGQVLVPVVVSTDGSCYPNPGPGGWAAVIETAGRVESREISGGDIEVSNNAMEILAVVMALESLPVPSRVLVRTDSQVAMNCATGKWGRNAESLQHLFARYDKERARHRGAISWKWVRGHSGDARNERADYLAGEARKIAGGPSGERGSDWVTAYCDAGFREDVGGTWGLWLQSDWGHIVMKSSDQPMYYCPSWVKDSQTAELCAIFAAMYVARDTWGQSMVGILVVSDSQGAIHWLRGKGSPIPSSPGGRMVSKIVEFVQEKGFQVRYRHIKGHCNPRGSMSAFLNWKVDQLATQAREEMVTRGIPSDAA